MKRTSAIIVLFLCAQAFGDGHFALTQRRHALKTRVFAGNGDHRPAPEPPPELFVKVRYPAPLGSNVAYVSPPGHGEKRPAIVWVHGGFNWAIGSLAWASLPRANDQSARAFRDAGIVLMLPALRGANDNPGRAECFLGEVDDILAAVDWLAKRPDVDKRRIYLGGHSTGGTLALLAAESSDRFRAVFAFGAVSDPRHYGEYSCLPADAGDEEAAPRAPGRFLRDIRVPTFIIEGGRRGNAGDYSELVLGSAPVKVLVVPDADHFSVLAPGTEVIARAIVADKSPLPKLDVTLEAIRAALAP